jgi:hypothetical protein
MKRRKIVKSKKWNRRRNKIRALFKRFRMPIIKNFTTFLICDDIPSMQPIFNKERELKHIL